MKVCRYLTKDGRKQALKAYLQSACNNCDSPAVSDAALYRLLNTSFVMHNNSSTEAHGRVSFVTPSLLVWFPFQVWWVKYDSIDTFPLILPICVSFSAAINMRLHIPAAHVKYNI